MLSRLRLSGWRHLLRHRWQSALSVFGITLGVAVVVAVDLSNQSANLSFKLSMEEITGRSTHHIVAAVGHLDETLYPDLRVRQGIRNSAPVIEGRIAIAGEQFTLLGLDPIAEQPFRPLLPGIGEGAVRQLLLRPDTLILPQSSAHRLGIQSGQWIELQVAGRPVSMEVVGTAGDADNSALDGVALAERLAALAEPERRRRIIEDVPDDGGFFQKAVLSNLGRIWRVDGEDIDYEPAASDSVAAEASRMGVPAMQLVLDQLVADGGNGMLYAPFFNYSYGDLSFTEAVTRHPHTRMGLSDGGAHCGAICDGGMNAHLAASGHFGMVLRRAYTMHRVGGGNTEPENVDISGPLCTSIDKLGTGVMLPRLEEGDLIAIHASGAYGPSASPVRFISHPEPREVWVDGAGMRDVTA